MRTEINMVKILYTKSILLQRSYKIPDKYNAKSYVHEISCFGTSRHVKNAPLNQNNGNPKCNCFEIIVAWKMSFQKQPFL